MQKNACQNCGVVISRGKWCSDKCRKAYGRKSDTLHVSKSDKPGQEPKSDTESRTDYIRPELPNDGLISANNEVTWSDIDNLSLAAISKVYRLSQRYDEDVYLRLRRAGGYRRRVA